MPENQDIAGQLRARFEKPLDECARRRIVIWHDRDGSFETFFDELAASGLGSTRPLSFAKASEGEVFSLKKRVSRDEPDADFLLYTRAEKDLSAKGLEGNWLADVELIAEHFQADYTSMLAEELGATDSAVEAIGAFRSFFNAASRRDRFKRLMPRARNAGDVALGVMGSVLSSPDLGTEAIVRSYLCALAAGEDPLSELGRYGADVAFAQFAEKRLGYAGDLSSKLDFSAHVLLTALSAQLPAGSLAGLETRVSAPHGQFCLNVIHAWMDVEEQAGVLYDLCRLVEGACNLPQRFSSMPSAELADADVFPCVNECLVAELSESMGRGADRADEALEIAQHRKDLRWFSRVGDCFATLEAAARIQRFYRAHAQDGFHLAVSRDIWKAYTGDWYQMDTQYRRFCKAVDFVQRGDSDLPDRVEAGMETLADWVENIYVGWFLSESNACWVNASENAWLQSGFVEGVPRQARFYEERVRHGAGNAKKTLVIISDALRYEVALELVARLEEGTRGSARLESMQGVFPSVTEFGMAALLPHKSMGFSMEDRGVYLDDGMPTASTPQRQDALRKAEPGAVCLQAKRLFNAKRDERREMVGDAAVVYVYHNRIDAIGEDMSTEDSVFEACDDAIDDLVALVKIATGTLNFSRVLVTADHGFLYTRYPLKESAKVSKADIGGETALLGRRYAVCDGSDPEAALFVKMNMTALDGGEYVGIAPRECIRIKKAGPGENYVHGGVSLQEMCVPVVEFRNMRSGQKGYEVRENAGFRLLSTVRRVTSMLFKVELLQDRPVGGKVVPAEYELVMTDASGNEVSDARRAVADMTGDDATARVSRVQLALKAGKVYDSHAAYYLLCREKQTGALAWKEEFQVDIPFAPADDFGF